MSLVTWPTTRNQYRIAFAKKNFTLSKADFRSGILDLGRSRLYMQGNFLWTWVPWHGCPVFESSRPGRLVRPLSYSLLSSTFRAVSHGDYNTCKPVTRSRSVGFHPWHDSQLHQSARPLPWDQRVLSTVEQKARFCDTITPMHNYYAIFLIRTTVFLCRDWKICHLTINCKQHEHIV